MHSRRRSGHASGNTSLTDVRKAVSATDAPYKKYSSRPAPMTRRITPQSAPKLRKSPRDREKEEEEHWWDEERESFPEYWYAVNTLTFHNFITPFALPFRNFPFHPSASSPDVRVIRVTQNAPSVRK